MRILLILAALPLLATFNPPHFVPPEAPPAISLVAFHPVALDRSDPRADRVGSLVYLGGWSIDSNDYRFGGISALHVEGGTAVALSDSGWLLRFPLPRRPGPVRASIAPLSDGPGAGTKKSQRDMESLTVSDGHAWIGFERVNMVWRYDRRDWRSDASAAPAAMRRWRANEGAEAMVRLPDGRFLVFSEGRGRGDSDVVLFDGDPALASTPSLKLRYRPPKGFCITDAAALPDGRILFLNRRYGVLNGAAAKLSLGRLPPLKAGALIGGRLIADFHPPVTIDNMEALSVETRGGRTIVWLASDDNYDPLQRTLLLKFALE